MPRICRVLTGAQTVQEPVGSAPSLPAVCERLNGRPRDFPFPVRTQARDEEQPRLDTCTQSTNRVINATQATLRMLCNSLKAVGKQGVDRTRRGDSPPRAPRHTLPPSGLLCLKGSSSPIDEPQTRHMGRFLGVSFFLSQTGTSLAQLHKDSCHVDFFSDS